MLTIHEQHKQVKQAGREAIAREAQKREEKTKAKQEQNRQTEMKMVNKTIENQRGARLR